MAAIRLSKSSSRSLLKRARQRKSVPQKMTAVRYAFAGSIADLQALEGDVLAEPIQTVLIPGTLHAEDALKSSTRFNRIRLKAYGLEKLQVKKVKAAPHREVTDVKKTQISAEAYEPDARAKAILRGKAYAAEDLKAAGGAYSVDEVRGLLNDISRQALDKRVKQGALLAVPGPNGARRFPTAQFDKDGGLVKGLKNVQETLSFSSPWAVLNFLVNANVYLNGQRPIDLLRQGRLEPVITAAASIGVQGA